MPDLTAGEDLRIFRPCEISSCKAVQLAVSATFCQERISGGNSSPKVSNKNMEENPAPPSYFRHILYKSSTFVPSICQIFFGPSKKVFQQKHTPRDPGCISGLMLFTASFGALLGGYISDALTKCLRSKKKTSSPQAGGGFQKTGVTINYQPKQWHYYKGNPPK